ncbi:MAG: type II toxin-antitoxin system PemK/MazF family toxin [Deltaproteobacteria bacterium]|nr:type II toxin-antitoxin system PemK/MazF family toxin [Deltaproteobacteria bacterium]
MVVAQGEVWWADLPDPAGSGPGFRRPVVVVQGDALNRSRLATVVCVPLTSNLRWAAAPGNVLLDAAATGLPKDSVANASQIVTVDRAFLSERVGRLARRHILAWCWPVSTWCSGVERGVGRRGRMATPPGTPCASLLREVHRWRLGDATRRTVGYEPRGRRWRRRRRRRWEKAARRGSTRGSRA